MTRAPVLIDATLLDDLASRASDTARRRLNLNFHTPQAEVANRLLNAVEPGSYIAPHRHADPTKDETMVVVRGRFGILFFDEAGEVTRTATLGARDDALGVDIPHGTYHALVALEPGSIFFEAKAGPYLPLGEHERAPWAPKEGDAEAPAYLARLEAHFA
ncbi:MAG: WbuC family cupin fold metalloprotein [Planctomycetes bacterium]|nr:WbuC family cupin fold metalloprotein [Planctomycetota bacterium]